jgi:hypothetical protein
MENSHGLSLFGLPTTILCTIFSKWLTVDSVAVLDIAVTDTAARNRLFEQLYVSIEFEFENNEIDDLNKTGDAKKFVLWLDKRHIRIRCMNLRSWKNVDADVFKIAAAIPHSMSLNQLCCERLTDIGINYLSESCTMIHYYICSVQGRVDDIEDMRYGQRHGLMVGYEMSTNFKTANHHSY